VNLPNALTASRLAAIPVLLVLLAVPFPWHDQIAAGVFLLASATDTLDGNLARRTGQVTELGKFLDPLADKLFVLSVLIALVQQAVLPAWVVVVIFSRELLITVLRSLRADRGVVAATPFGKTKTVLQVLAVLLLILLQPYPVLQLPAALAVLAALVFTVASGIDYLWRFRRVWFESDRAAGNAGVSGPGGGEQGRGGSKGAEPLEPLDPLARTVGERLRSAGLTLVTAESCTGGLLSGALTDPPGSSNWFLGGIIAYSNEAKRSQLGVPDQVLQAHGAVSAETAQAMAEGVRGRLGGDLGVSVTGIAGPAADETTKEIGLTHLWLDGLGSSEGRRFVFGGDRWQNREQAVREALRMVLERVTALDESNKRS
jgi:CDP-diacylglycerol--glycerol-3-phosphate 3-phosphatidyltransferase